MIWISGQERDVLYEAFRDRLSGIDDLRKAVDRGCFATAQRLGVEFADILQVVTGSLGWGDHLPEDMVMLSTQPDVLRRAIGRVEELAVGLDASDEAERSELHRQGELNQALIGACRHVLNDLQRNVVG